MQSTKISERLTVYLDPDLIIQAKIQAIKEKISVAELISKLLIQYISSNAKP